LTERDEETAKPITNPRRLGLRGASQPVKTERAATDETANPIHCIMSRHLDEGVPVTQYLEKCDLKGAEPLIPALCAGGPADEVNNSSISWHSSGHGDHLPARHLG
jgi:hypothetical protein